VESLILSRPRDWSFLQKLFVVFFQSLQASAAIVSQIIDYKTASFHVLSRSASINRSVIGYYIMLAVESIVN
jgi:hypothetical protein